MGQVILSLEEYEELRKKADLAAQVRDCFSLDMDYKKDVVLNITVSKAAEIFKAMFDESVYNDGSYEIKVDLPWDNRADVASFYVKAVKKADEPTEELEEVLTQEKNQGDEE